MAGADGMSWLHRLRERGVIRVAASYAIITWLLLQIADVTFEPLGVPRWVMVSLIVTAVLGFPAAVALAWFYETDDGGVTRDTAAEGMPRPVVHGLRRYADVAIIGVLLAAVAVLLVRQSDLGPSGAKGMAIAVLPFENLSKAANGEVQDGSTGTFLSTLLAAAMLLDGEQERARRLLAETIARTEHEVRDLERPEFWYRHWYALALALNGDREASIAALQRYANARAHPTGAYPTSDWQLYFELEPAIAAMREHPRFQELVRKSQEHVAAERRALDRMREEGLVPDRSKGGLPAN